MSGSGSSDATSETAAGLADIYCGVAIQDVQTTFSPKSTLWSSQALLAGLKREDIHLSDAVAGRFREALWNDVCSEYDAENFCVYLDHSGQTLSPEFTAFERVWRRDEFNHYVGFRFIYSILFGCSPEWVAKQMAERHVDFTPLGEFLRDEFLICLILAYDEIVTTRAYAGDYEIYRSFGHPAFSEWISRVTRDEAFHFHNCMEVIRRQHPDRIGEIPAVVERLVEWDLGCNPYRGTFVLDHDGEQFTPGFLRGCARKIINYYY